VQNASAASEPAEPAQSQCLLADCMLAVNTAEQTTADMHPVNQHSTAAAAVVSE